MMKKTTAWNISEIGNSGYASRTVNGFNLECVPENKQDWHGVCYKAYVNGKPVSHKEWEMPDGAMDECMAQYKKLFKQQQEDATWKGWDTTDLQDGYAVRTMKRRGPDVVLEIIGKFDGEVGDWISYYAYCAGEIVCNPHGYKNPEDARKDVVGYYRSHYPQED